MADPELPVSRAVELHGMGLAEFASLALRRLGQPGLIIAEQALPSVRLTRGLATDPWGKRSRLGGQPLVAAGFEWPRTDAGKALSFVAQLNTADVAADVLLPLPQDTLLAFFFEADEQHGWGFDPAHRQYWHVCATPLERAVVAAAPPDSRSFTSRALRPRKVVTVPDSREPPLDERWGYDDDDFNAIYDDLENSSSSDAPRHRMFGWPDLVQNPMRLECQLASNGVNVGHVDGYDESVAEQLSAGADDWILLLQLDTDDEVGWMWGDSGTIYYWIREEDLKACRFDRVWMVLQCC
jgi:uncharacterized protein YwqG